MRDVSNIDSPPSSNRVHHMKRKLLKRWRQNRNLELRQNLELKPADKIYKNFKCHMGANWQLTDIEKAVESVANRDYPQLNSARIPPIFVPKLFLAAHPQAIDMDLYLEEVLQPKKQNLELELEPDMDFAKQLRTIQKRNHEHSFTDNEKKLLEKFKEYSDLDGKMRNVKGDKAEKMLYNFLQASLQMMLYLDLLVCYMIFPI